MLAFSLFFQSLTPFYKASVHQSVTNYCRSDYYFVLSKSTETSKLQWTEIEQCVGEGGFADCGPVTSDGGLAGRPSTVIPPGVLDFQGLGDTVACPHLDHRSLPHRQQTHSTCDFTLFISLPFQPIQLYLEILSFT